MSAFGDIILRSNGVGKRKEDEPVIYYPGDNSYENIYDDYVSGYDINIWTDGRYPTLVIDSHKYDDCCDGPRCVPFQFPDGRNILLTRLIDSLSYSYSANGDYVTGKRKGRRYSVSEIMADAKVIIKALQEKNI